MKYLKTFVLLGCFGLFATMWISNARGDEWDKSTKLTFNNPVEVPGTVLEPGTYLFRLLGSASDRDIVEVFNADKTRIYDTFIAIPDYRLVPTGKTVVTFEERTAGSPEAIKAGFIPVISTAWSLSIQSRVPFSWRKPASNTCLPCRLRL